MCILITLFHTIFDSKENNLKLIVTVKNLHNNKYQN